MAVEAEFAEHVVTSEALYARSVYAADLDGDGDLDLMSASQIDDAINWYRNNGGPSPTFTPFTVGYVDGAQHVIAADVDDDGDVDMLTASEFDHTISLYENNGAAQPEFVWRPIDQTANGVHAVYADDLDGDGDLDLVAAVEKLNAFKWYENNGQRPAQFTPHLVFDRALAAHGIHTDDIDGDGDTDLIGISRDDGVVAWFENRGGNYAVGVEQNSSDVHASGQLAELAQILVAHRGRPGDANIELHSLEFTFWNSSGDQLDDASFQNWVESVSIYRDTLDGQLNPSEDQLLVQLAMPVLNSQQRLAVPMPSDSGGVQIGPGQTQLFFLVVEMTDVCATSANQLGVSMVLSSRTARDALFKAPMLAESVARAADDGGTDDEPAAQQLFINEFMASNASTWPDPDEISEYPDWIEIYNAGPLAVDLGGMYLTDDLGEPTKYRIPAGVTVPAHGYTVFIADGEETQGPRHTNFRLSSTGESIGLFDTDAKGNQVIDLISYDEQMSDVPFGRYPNGGETWMALGAATPEALNMHELLDPQVYLPVVTSGRISRSACQ